MSPRKSNGITVSTATLATILLVNALFHLISAESTTSSLAPKAVPQASKIAKSSHKSNTSSEDSSESHKKSNEEVVYVSSTPKAPKNFISTTLKPEEAALHAEVMAAVTSTTAPPKKTQNSTTMAAGLTKVLKGSKVTKRKTTNTLLESTICGRVPIFEKKYQQSVNEAFAVKTDDSDDEGGDFRILHGMDATPGEWPWIVKLEICKFPAQSHCGGCTASLINSRWVITAGHCAIAEVGNYKGVLGKYDMLVKEKTETEVKFDKMIRHPNYTDDFQNDLTLFRLDKPVELNDYIQPVCLIDQQHNDSVAFTKNRKCYNVGYGLTESHMEALKLQKLQVEAKKPEECNNATMDALKLVKDSLCIGPRADQVGASCKVSVTILSPDSSPPAHQY